MRGRLRVPLCGPTLVSRRGEALTLPSSPLTRRSLVRCPWSIKSVDLCLTVVVEACGVESRSINWRLDYARQTSVLRFVRTGQCPSARRTRGPWLLPTRRCQRSRRSRIPTSPLTRGSPACHREHGVWIFLAQALGEHLAWQGAPLLHSSLQQELLLLVPSELPK
jgi:hypothetical protein